MVVQLKASGKCCVQCTHSVRLTCCRAFRCAALSATCRLEAAAASAEVSACFRNTPFSARTPAALARSSAN